MASVPVCGQLITLGAVGGGIEAGPLGCTCSSPGERRWCPGPSVQGSVARTERYLGRRLVAAVVTYMKGFKIQSIYIKA